MKLQQVNASLRHPVRRWISLFYSSLGSHRVSVLDTGCILSRVYSQAMHSVLNTVTKDEL